MGRVSDAGVLEILLITLLIYVVIPAAVIFLFVWSLIWICRTTNKNKKKQIQEPRGSEQVRCLGCGAVIDSKQQSCQICGWTWK